MDLVIISQIENHIDRFFSIAALHFDLVLHRCHRHSSQINGQLGDDGPSARQVPWLMWGTPGPGCPAIHGNC